ncbi:hypothetical protein R1flu_011011 [Riccia fluitans]|uniref:Uncharacterized protein n=1 Tax=Riccia fluitans TaxID=41844 RepID=A0ABD1Z6L8_9MARC
MGEGCTERAGYAHSLARSLPRNCKCDEDGPRRRPPERRGEIVLLGSPGRANVPGLYTNSDGKMSVVTGRGGKHLNVEDASDELDIDNDCTLSRSSQRYVKVL